MHPNGNETNLKFLKQSNSNRVPRAILDYIGSLPLRSVIGLENPCHPVNQSDARLTPIATL